MENFIHGLVGKLRTTDTLYVCRGGTIDNSNILMRIKDQLIVPKYFFSAALLKNDLGYKAIAFWFEHSNTPVENLRLSNYVVNIRELETLTGIDFFCNLDDETEEHVETLAPENIITSWGVK
jgi:endonuclease G